MSVSRPIPLSNAIMAFMHCSRCLRELPSEQSPREFAAIEMGFTEIGLQVWCRRHELNICHIDFEGQRHPASMDTEVV